MRNKLAADLLRGALGERGGTGAAILALSAIPFLPLRPVAAIEGRERTFALVVEKAAPGDAEAIRKAAKWETDRRLQQLFAARWEAMLAGLRTVLGDPTAGATQEDRVRRAADSSAHLGAAIAAASDTRAFAEFLAIARRADDDGPVQRKLPVRGPRPAAPTAPSAGDTELERLRALAAMRDGRGGRG